MSTDISDNIPIHSFSEAIFGHLDCKHHWQSCSAMLQIIPRSATEDTEASKRITYTKNSSMCNLCDFYSFNLLHPNFYVSTYFSLD